MARRSTHRARLSIAVVLLASALGGGIALAETNGSADAGGDPDDRPPPPPPYRYRPAEFVESYSGLRSELEFARSGAPPPPPPRSSSGCGVDDGGESSATVGACAGASSPPPPPRGRLVAAAVQMSSSGSESARDFLDRAVRAVERAVSDHGATLVLLQELFLGPYFCQSQDADLFGLAEDLGGGGVMREGIESGDSPFLGEMRDLARRLGVVLPVSLFERRNNVFYNTVVMIESDGSILGRYRKSHIPDGTGYMEKFYFSPGDTGFRVFRTSVGNVGVGICWDQWFPEAARAMALMGADVLLYPTAIGSEPQEPTLDSRDHWQRVMQGHAAANMVPVVAANRAGTEILLDPDGAERQRINFYGSSFITDETGAILAEAARNEGGDGEIEILSAEIDAAGNRAKRAAWGLFRDRRPELYGVLRTKDGEMVV